MYPFVGREIGLTVSQSFDVEELDSGTRIRSTKGSLFVQGGNITKSDDGGKQGGILVQEYDKTINLFGSVDRLYQLSDAITVTKLTRLSFSFNQSIDLEQTSICFYEDLTTNVINGCESTRCYSPKVGENEINMGGIFHDRNTTVQYMKFKRIGSFNDTNTENDKSTVSNLLVETKRTAAIINNFGLCIDPNSVILQSPRGPSCRCLDGFFSSNGGNVQGLHDSCVSCLLRPDCPYDATIMDAVRKTGMCGRVSHEISMSM